MSFSNIAWLYMCLCASALVSADKAPTIRSDVVYGHKDGMALTMDMFAPARPNGAGILFIQSGGWYSVWTDPKQALPACEPFLDSGFTVFLVRHGSAPKYNIPEIVEDVRRSVRYVRLHAKEFGVDRNRLGSLGGSAGGHLALMLGTDGDEGDPKASDPVLRQSCRVAATVALYAPSDIRGWVADPPEAVRRIPALKPPLTFDAARAVDYSPVARVTSATAPTLLIHGDHDEMVDVTHSVRMRAALEKAGVESNLIVIKGAGHVFTAADYKIAVPAMVAWFQRHLSARK